MVKPKESETFTDYIDAEGKRLIQSRFLESIGIGFRSSVLGLPGPNLPDYNTFVAQILGKEHILYGFEIDKLTHAIQEKQLYYLDNKDRIILHKGNIEHAEPQRFIDLDLTHTWKTEEAMIAHLFQKQYNMPNGSDQKRVLIVSVTTRGSSLEESVSFMNDILNTSVGYLEAGSPLVTCDGTPMARKYNLTGDSKQFSIELYTYRDSATMANFLIQY